MQFPYAGTIFSVYESKIAERCETFVKCVFMKMKQMKFNRIEQLKMDDDLLTLGRLLFTLYIGIQNFLKKVVQLFFFSSHISRKSTYD